MFLILCVSNKKILPHVCALKHLKMIQRFFSLYCKQRWSEEDSNVSIYGSLYWRPTTTFNRLHSTNKTFCVNAVYLCVFVPRSKLLFAKQIAILELRLSHTLAHTILGTDASDKNWRKALAFVISWESAASKII